MHLQKLSSQNLYDFFSQVERLSRMVEKCSECLRISINSEERVKVINSTVSIEARIVKLFSLIENDLYGSLQATSAQISVYRPRKTS